MSSIYDQLVPPRPISLVDKLELVVNSNRLQQNAILLGNFDNDPNKVHLY